MALIGTEMVARTRRIHSGLADEMLHAANEQFIPAGVAGALLTFVLYRFAPQSLWMLPGLWQIVFSLGVFASCRSLPRAMFAAGVWYLAAGLGSLAFASGNHAFSPYAMAVPYGVGQIADGGRALSRRRRGRWRKLAEEREPAASPMTGSTA